MSKDEIKIGTCDGKPVTLDLSELIVSKLLATASSGGGKSVLLRSIFEQAAPLVTNGHVTLPALKTLTPPSPKGEGSMRAYAPAAAMAAAGETSMGRGALRDSMVALAQFSATGLTSRRLGALVGIVDGGSTMRGVLAKARAAGWVTLGGVDPIRITETGLAALGSYEPLPTGPEAIDQWRRKLGTGVALAMFDALVEAGGADVIASELAAAANCTIGGSTYRGALAELRNLGIVDRGRTAAAAELFE